MCGGASIRRCLAVDQEQGSNSSINGCNMTLSTSIKLAGFASLLDTVSQRDLWYSEIDHVKCLVTPQQPDLPTQ